MAPRTVDETELRSLIDEGTVVADFYADWCAPCRALAPEIETLAGQLGERATVVKVDIDANPGIAEELKIMSIPTVIHFSAGDEAGRMVGVARAADLADRLGLELEPAS